MSDELELPEDQIRERNMEVVRLTAEGRTKEYIRSQTGLTARQQRAVNEEYKTFVRSDLWTANRSREIIGYMDEHFGAIIVRLYEVVDAAEMNDDYKNKGNALKLIAEVEAKRADALQKAGVLSAQSLGDDVAASNARQEKIMTVLKNFAVKHPELAKELANDIASIDNEVIATNVVEEDE